MARCKICNKVASNLFDGVCTKCLCVRTEEENKIIDGILNGAPGPVDMLGDDINKKGGFVRFVGGAKKSDIRPGALHEVHHSLNSSSKGDFNGLDNINTSMIVGEFTPKDARAFKVVLEKLNKKYGAFFKRKEYFICKKSAYTGEIPGDIVEERAGLYVLRKKGYYDPDKVLPNSYTDDEAEITVDEDEFLDLSNLEE